MTDISQEYLLKLKQQLPRLAFDCNQDMPVDQWPFCHEYLQFYNFPEQPDTQHFFGQMPALDYQLATHYWLPKNAIATVCIVHGYFDHTGLYGHLIRYLLEKNYAVAVFDLPGHGLSSGEQANIESFNHYEQVFSCLLGNIKQLPSPIHAVGQSTGGAILLNYLLTQQSLDQPVKLDKVILLAPLIQPAHWKKDRLVYNILRRFKKKKTVRRKFRENASNPQFIDFVKHQDPLQSKHLPIEWVGAMKQWIEDFNNFPSSKHPITLIQGNQDKTVNWRFNCAAIKEKLPNFQETNIPNANHHLVNESDELRQQVFKSMNL